VGWWHHLFGSLCVDSGRVGGVDALSGIIKADLGSGGVVAWIVEKYADLLARVIYCLFL
jgi:hypothetical protein